MNLSIIITAKKEPSTVGPLITSLENELETENLEAEILLVCPDRQTKQAGVENDQLGLLTWLQDPAEGKPAALNLAFSKAKGKILVLTDGDVRWKKGTLKKLLDKFNPDIGLVSGHPVPINPKNEVFGFWAHFLTYVADFQRRRKIKKREYLDASGYLLAVEKKLVEPMPKNILVDDAYLSRLVWSQGKKIGYQPKAEIRIKFPTNLSDWVKQKKRTLSGYVQLRQQSLFEHDKKTRSFAQEVKGVRLVISFATNFKELWWIFLLIIARLYVWILVFIETKIFQKKFSGNWARIESTK